jgi:hypothetical protein
VSAKKSIPKPDAPGKPGCPRLDSLTVERALERGQLLGRGEHPDLHGPEVMIRRQ